MKSKQGKLQNVESLAKMSKRIEIWERQKCLKLKPNFVLWQSLKSWKGFQNWPFQPQNLLSDWKMVHCTLESCLENIWTMIKNKILSHSFRAGLVTAMTRLGYSDDDIFKIGRWHSQSFVNYLKTARIKRMKIAKEMAGKMATL